MGQASINAVLAGTKGFAVALLAPLTARIGNRPRVAADPAQVLGLCSGPSALAVVEFTGEGSLPTIQGLVRDGQGLRVVAGVPTAHSAAEGTLLAMGVEIGRWDGKIEGMVAAVDRAVAAMSASGAAHAPTQGPVASRPPTPAARPPAAAAPRPPPPQAGAPIAATPIAPPAAPAAPRPASQGASPAVRAPAAAPRPSRPAIPAAAARSAAAPSTPGRPASTAPAPAGAAARPAAPAAAASSAAAPSPAAPRAAPPADPPPPALSRQPAPRPMASAAPASLAPASIAPASTASPASAVPAAAAPLPPPAASPAAPRPASNLFDDLDDDDIPIDEEPPPPDVDFHAAGVYVPPAPARAARWPATLCSDAEAEEALRRALSGGSDPGPLHGLAIRVLEAASSLERDVLEGKPQAIDVAPIRKATAMRLRVAQALASVPPAGSAVDGAALSAILAQIDALLAEVAPLLQGASDELAPALEAVRNSLVSEAIDFSEAASRVDRAEAPPVAPAPAATARAAAARGVSIDSAAEVAIDQEKRRKTWIAYVVLAVVLLLAIGFHGWRYATRDQARPQAGMPGAPPDTMSSSASGGVYMVVSRTGKFDPAVLQRFRAEQDQKGNRVEEVAPGVLRVSPAAEHKD